MDASQHNSELVEWRRRAELAANDLQEMERLAAGIILSSGASTSQVQAAKNVWNYLRSLRSKARQTPLQIEVAERRIARLLEALAD
ncbi:hypothetical protein [Bosea sp. TAF32]|uniref:hypothetical protein n=1 Tax=Bosea sp. TAF32 TaxID=3237482 RepID=UPI003F91526A